MVLHPSIYAKGIPFPTSRRGWVVVLLQLFLLAGTAVSVLLINTPAKGDGMYTITKNK